MVDDEERTDLAAKQNAERHYSAKRNRGDGATPRTDMNVSEFFDVDSYAQKIYEANLHLSAADAQMQYDSTPELRALLARASAVSTVRRRRARRT